MTAKIIHTPAASSEMTTLPKDQQKILRDRIRELALSFDGTKVAQRRVLEEGFVRLSCEFDPATNIMMVDVTGE